jgi:hypothetical protein
MEMRIYKMDHEYHVVLNDINFSEVYNWATDEFGQANLNNRWEYYHQTTYSTDNFLFKYEEDAILFALRWK